MKSPGGVGRLAECLFRALLRLYPGGFPRVLEVEMAAAFRYRCRAAAERFGAWGVVAVLGRECLDLAANAVLEWSEPNPVQKGDEHPMDTLLQDLRYAVRSLVQRPAFAAVSIAILALAIGGTTGIFTLVDRLILQPPPGIGNADDLLGVALRQNDRLSTSFSHPHFEYLRDSSKVFTGVAASAPVRLDFQADAEPERLRGFIVSGNYFSVLNVSLPLGRGFLPEETANVGGEKVVVVSYATWRERFGSDPELVGSDIRLNGHPYTVVGVAPEGFRGFSALAPVPEVWVPLSTQPTSMPVNWNPLESNEDFWLALVARLGDGVRREQAQAATDLVVAQLLEAQGAPADVDIGVVLLDQFAFTPHARELVVSMLTLLMAVVGLVLVIACANLAGLLLTRAAAREREMGIRLAMGASRARVLRLLLTESVLISAVGGLLGLLVSGAVARLVVGLTRQPISIDTRPDAGVLVFALAVSLATGLLFGLAPALHAARGSISRSLKEGLGAAGVPRALGRSALVVSQVALSVVLLVASGLFVRSLLSLQSIDPGFEAEGLLMSTVDLRPQGYDDAATFTLYRELLESVRALPGVRAATLSNVIPFSGHQRGGGFLVEGRGETGDGEFDTGYDVVGPDYFKTFGIALRKGREFTFDDHAGAPGVVIVNQSLARLAWPGENALGKRISRSGPGGPWLEVVGVVADHKIYSLSEDPVPYFYRPLLQRRESSATVFVRPEVSAMALAEPIREQVRRLNPNLPVFGVGTLDEVLGRSAAPFEVSAMLTSLFGLLALVLAAVGLYGLITYSVVQRTREIGIRMALGAGGDSVVGLMVRRGLVLVAAGLVVGLVAAGFVTRFLRGMLYAVQPGDPAAFGGAALVLLAIAFLACYLPARRASRVDPVDVLRAE